MVRNGFAISAVGASAAPYLYGRMLGAARRRGQIMSNPLVKKDLVDAILELRADVEKQLQANIMWR